MNWMTTARRRAQLKQRGRGGQRPVVVHHMTARDCHPAEEEESRRKKPRPAAAQNSHSHSSERISRDILFLRKPEPRRELVSTDHPVTQLDVDVSSPAAVEENHEAQNVILLFNDGNSVREDGSIVQPGQRIDISPRFDTLQLNNVVQNEDNWPKQFYSMLAALGNLHRKRLDTELRYWEAKPNISPSEVLPCLYGALNGGPVSGTSPLDMNKLLDLIRYAEIVEKNICKTKHSCSEVQVQEGSTSPIALVREAFSEESWQAGVDDAIAGESQKYQSAQQYEDPHSSIVMMARSCRGHMSLNDDFDIVLNQDEAYGDSDNYYSGNMITMSENRKKYIYNSRSEKKSTEEHAFLEEVEEEQPPRPPNNQENTPPLPCSGVMALSDNTNKTYYDFDEWDLFVN